MKRFFQILACLVALAAGSFSVSAQSCYWVFLSDKNGSDFDPYTYFDDKAIERYRINKADLYDISNYPLAEKYVNQVTSIAEEVVGQSRWFNAMAVMAMPDQIEQIRLLPFVADVHMIASDMQIAAYRQGAESEQEDCEWAMYDDSAEYVRVWLTDQLKRMQGQLLKNHGYYGQGVRIAVFDGGFPSVNTHKAFQHLRDNNLILKTWNFCNNKENVYGWNSHGTMTLSCITGLCEGRQMGLALNSEFLLARTEVSTEPFKEEVWWLEAVEWADKNGAQLISSSLGYGKERHYVTEMDGTSFVAKAANLAARKGILVCNSAGNEGDDNQWKTIITPADADSVLCVGGIQDDLEHYRHISFSSYGPSADGRLKPNVCAYGHAWAASPSKDDAVKMVYGTSFSCPLVAGFIACAWQSRPGTTAMQMMDEVQRSADLYPYYDYALGYGVPQASYFMTLKHEPVTGMFEITETADEIDVVINGELEGDLLLFNVQNSDGLLYEYYTLEPYQFKDGEGPFILKVTKKSLGSRTLNVHYRGQTLSYRLSEADLAKLGPQDGEGHIEYKLANVRLHNGMTHRALADNKPSKWGSNSKCRYDVYFQAGESFAVNAGEVSTRWFPLSGHVGFRLMTALTKTYCLGAAAELNRMNFRLPSDKVNVADAQTPTVPISGVQKKLFSASDLALELFQRVRLVSGGMAGKGLHWDVGVYGSWGFADSYTVEYEPSGVGYKRATMQFDGLEVFEPYRWSWGLATRVSYDWIGIYARYRMKGLLSDIQPELGLPRLEVGLQIQL